MTVPASAWIRLAQQAARAAQVRDGDIDDAVGAILEDYSRYPPASEAIAVYRGRLRAIDYLRSWYGRPSRGLKRMSSPADPKAFRVALEQLVDQDDALGIVELIDELDRSTLSDRELEAIVTNILDISAQEVDRVHGLQYGATAQALRRARIKLAG